MVDEWEQKRVSEYLNSRNYSLREVQEREAKEQYETTCHSECKWKQAFQHERQLHLNTLEMLKKADSNVERVFVKTRDIVQFMEDVVAFVGEREFTPKTQDRPIKKGVSFE